MVDGIFVALDAPLQRISRNGSGNREAIADAGLDFSSLFVVIPRDELQVGQLLSGIVECVDLGERLQPGLTALLTHHAVGSPRRESIVETLIGGANRFFIRERHSGVVEA